MEQILRREFCDFDALRGYLPGWDTEPVQLGAGPLRLRWDALSLGDLELDLLRTNRHLTDLSRMAPDRVALVFNLAPMTWNGLRVPARSLVIHAAGREHRSTLPTGFSSLELSVSRERAADAGLFADSVDPRNLPPEECVVAPEPELGAALAALALRLGAGVRGSIASCGDPELQVLALLARALRRASAGTAAPVPRYALAAAALERIERPAAEARRTVQELAEDLGVTRRSLEYAFRSALGVSPSGYLAARRLNRVRRDLIAERAGSVTAAAGRHGFQHLGRFAAQYRRLFGEPPSQTLRASQAAG